MRYFVTFIVVFVLATTHVYAQFNFDSAWNKVIYLMGNGGQFPVKWDLEKIDSKARAEKNEAQLLKLLFYRIRYVNFNDNDSKENAIISKDKQMVLLSPASRAILYSMKAELLYDYFRENMYSINSRTAIANDTSADVSTWAADRFNREIAAAYAVSLQDADLLKKVKISEYAALLNDGNTKALRPTLYDLLLHRALAYYYSGYSTLRDAANQFELLDPAAFAPAPVFATHKFITTDSSSLQYKAVVLLQDAIKTYSAGNKAILLSLDLERAGYIKGVAVMANKSELYEKLLYEMMKTYTGEKGVTEVYYLLASLYRPIAEGNDNRGEWTPQTAMKKVIDLCEKAYQLAPDSYGGILCFNMMNEIRNQSFHIKTERINLPGAPFRALATYRNVDSIHFAIARIDAEFPWKLETTRPYEMNYKNCNYWNQVAGVQVSRSWKQLLPGSADNRKHTAEVKIDALPVGTYLLIGSKHPDFRKDTNLISIQVMNISNLSYITRGSDNENLAKEMYVLHRKTGLPMKGVKVDVMQAYTGNEFILYESVVSGKDGYVPLKKEKYHYDYKSKYRLVAGTDTLLPLEYGNLNEEDEYWQHNEKEMATFLFTDRAVYRPGQTIYFKGIVIDKSKQPGQRQVLPGYHAQITLRDADGSKVNTMTVTTNQYGTYNGSFTLPTNRMNGVFSIHAGDYGSQVRFRVEEYKRPTFYLSFDSLKGSPRLDDAVTITAKAIAYSGNNIDGAKVVYRVSRYVYVSRPDRKWKNDDYYEEDDDYDYDENKARQITKGITQTNADGSFTITFPALPDRNIPVYRQPVFRYEIAADVTDLNGETRSGNTIVQVAYEPLAIKIGLKDQVLMEELRKTRISTVNLSGTFEPTDIKISLQPLQHPGRLLRERYWRNPDQFTLSREEYESAFPNDIYDNEDVSDNWPRGITIMQQEVQTVKDGTVQWQLPLLAAGWYELAVIAKGGQSRKVFELVDPAAASLPYPAYCWYYADEKNVLPGERSSCLLRSSPDSLYLIETAANLVTMPLTTTYTAGNGIADRSYIVKESDRGDAFFRYAFVKNNRFYTVNRTVNVPWDDKKLTVRVGTHRDKLLPGEKETWQVNISGANRDKAGAELMATMYDASLDAIEPFSWRIPSIYPGLNRLSGWEGHINFRTIESGDGAFNMAAAQLPVPKYTYDELNWFGAKENGASIIDVGKGNGLQPVLITGFDAGLRIRRAREAERERMRGVSYAVSSASAPQPAAAEPFSSAGITLRKNFRETAFFLPELHTDKNGDISFSFTMLEALTRWHFMGLAHTRDAKFGYVESNVITQQPLMIQANAPRFVREGDDLLFSAKVSNLTDSTLTGDADLELLDAGTMQPVNDRFGHSKKALRFKLEKGRSTAVTFPLRVPKNFGSTLMYRIVARAGNFSDGEENALPVLTSTMLVTETLPLMMHGDGKKAFDFDRLLKSGASETLQQHALTLEYTGNPTWYAVQALPYMMEYPHECSEQLFNRYYSNKLATHIVNAWPEVKRTFDNWRITDTATLISNLKKNEELKSALLEETPWVLEAKSEAEQKKRIALLFDLQRMKDEERTAWKKLEERQSENGGFSWFPGMKEDLFITQYILAGIGHLQQLGLPENEDTKAMVNSGLDYADKQIYAWYRDVKKNGLHTETIGYLPIHYLYMRSLFKKDVPEKYNEVYFYILSKATNTWQKMGIYQQAMLAIALKDTTIIHSLRERATVNDEMGMYWKEIPVGYWWYEAPIETQAMLIEAFEKVAHDSVAVASMKTWLLKNKQTNSWPTTKATAEACYAMLMGGSNWLKSDADITIQLGSTLVNEKKEAGTGYFKKQFNASEVKPAMGKIAVNVSGSGGQPSWGAVYWQYFQQLDKITAAATPLTLQKELFIETTNERGQVLTAISDGNQLKVGDKVKVRIIMKADRDMEYIHLKDMRAACFEPEEVISRSGWQNGVCYYQSTKDVSVNFFFSQLQKGVYVFEYRMFVTHEGDFSNGISTAQCMYAPEFSAHSEGIRVKVRE